MKMKVVLGILVLSLLAAFNPSAFAQTNLPAASATDLVMRNGTVYHNFHIEKADATGLLISYKLEDGGVGITRLAYADLPENLQSQYGYDPRNSPSPDAANVPVQRAAPRIKRPEGPPDAVSGGG